MKYALQGECHPHMYCPYEDNGPTCFTRNCPHAEKCKTADTKDINCPYIN